jgi:prophage regulatory protein
MSEEIVNTAPRKMLSEKSVLALVPIARSTLHAWIAADAFPKSVPIGPGRRAWFEDDVATWQRARVTAQAA